VELYLHFPIRFMVWYSVKHRDNNNNVKERDLSEDLGIDNRTILEWILGKVWTVCIWLRIVTSGGLL
jgi:hypothetical protein